MGTKGRRTLAATAAVLGVAVLGWMAAAAQQRGWGEVDPAGVLVGVLGLVFSVYVWRRSEAVADAETATARLARAVHEREKQAWRQLLGGDVSALIDLGFTATAVGKVKLPSENEAPRNVEDLANFYRRVQPRRLVITGTSVSGPASASDLSGVAGAAAGTDAGTGKTVAVIKLLLDWVTEWQPGQPVPVRLSAGAWPGGSIEHWLLAHLTRVLRLRATEAREIVRAGLVVPVIDGLDEMDGTDAPGHGSPAATLLDKLNNSQLGAGQLPVVVTCRATHYAALTAVDRQLSNVAVLQLNRVDPVRAQDYLASRVGQRDAGGRWETVFNALRPGNASSPAVQSALDSPWRLTLAAMVFQERGPDGSYQRHPDELISQAEAGTLRIYLLNRYIAAAVSTACGAETPDHKETARRQRLRRQGAKTVWRYLAVLATYLQANTPGGGSARVVAGRALSGTDLVLHELWPLAGDRKPQAVGAFLAVGISALAPVSWAVMTAVDPTFRNLGFVLVLATLTLFSLAMPFLWQPEWPQPHRINSERLRALRSWRVLIGAVSLVLLALWTTWAWIVVAACALGIHYRLLGADRAPVTDPRVPLREDFKSWFVIAAPLGALGVFPVVLQGQSDAGGTAFAAAMVLGMVVILTALLTMGLVVRPLLPVALVALTRWDTPPAAWQQLAQDLVDGSEDRMERGAALGSCLRYLALLLCTRGLLPWRLGRFLDDSYNLGLLRVAGVAWQFRHRELQEHLATHPRPPLV